MKEDKNEKIEVNVKYSDFKLINKFFNNKLKTTFYIITIITLLFFLFGFTGEDPITTDEYLLVCSIFITIYSIIYLILDIITKKLRYKKYIKKKKDYVKYNLTFFDDHIFKETINKSEKIYYSSIKKIKENDLVLLLLLDDNNVLVIHKQDLKENTLLHLKYMLDNAIHNDNLDIDEYLEKNSKIDKRNNVIKVLLIILFIACFLSLPIGMAIMTSMLEKNNVSGLDFIKYTSCLYYVLPIPVLSIILGFIYKRKGFKCIKNIVAGFIMSAILLIYGSFSFIPSLNFTTDYKEFKDYQDIISVKLPDEALEYQKIIPTSSYLEENIWNIVKYNDNEWTTKFYEDIVNNENWITKEKISTNLNNFVIYSYICTGNLECYYSVYIDELNTYNIVPQEDGKYRIYSMFYDPNNRKLEIQEYSYNYKK